MSLSIPTMLKVITIIIITIIIIIIWVGGTL